MLSEVLEIILLIILYIIYSVHVNACTCSYLRYVHVLYMWVKCLHVYNVYMYDAIGRAICYRFSSEEWISTEKWPTMIFSQSFVCQSVWFVHTCCMWILKWQKRIVGHCCQSALLCTCAMQIFFFWCTLHINFITAVIFDIWKHMKPNGSYTVILTYSCCVCVCVYVLY